jgi:hypothetical protein
MNVWCPCNFGRFPRACGGGYVPKPAQNCYPNTQMTLITNALITIALGALGWIALEFIGRPVRSFFDLRRKIKALMLDCEDIPTFSIVRDYASQQYIPNKEDLRKLAHEMIAFGQSACSSFSQMAWFRCCYSRKPRCDPGRRTEHISRRSLGKLQSG